MFHCLRGSTASVIEFISPNKPFKMRYQLSFLLCILVFVMNGQESMKGLWRINQTSAIGTYSSSVKAPSTLFMNVPISVAKFTDHKTLVGIDVSLSTFRVTDSSINSFSNPYYNVAIFTRKYFTNSSIKPFIGAKVGLKRNFSSNQFDFDFGPGIAYFLSDQMSIDLAIDFNISYAPFTNVTVVNSSTSSTVYSLSKEGKLYSIFIRKCFTS